MRKKFEVNRNRQIVEVEETIFEDCAQSSASISISDFIRNYGHLSDAVIEIQSNGYDHDYGYPDVSLIIRYTRPETAIEFDARIEHEEKLLKRYQIQAEKRRAEKLAKEKAEFELYKKLKQKFE
jgi:hypothetical protein